MYICRLIVAVCSKLTDWRCSSAVSTLDCSAAFSEIKFRRVNLFLFYICFVFCTQICVSFHNIFTYSEKHTVTKTFFSPHAL